jgi:peptide chain release factor 2
LTRIGYVAGMIDEADLKIDVYRSSGPDGSTDRAVRVTRLPSGLMAAAQGHATKDDDIAAATSDLEAQLRRFGNPS